MQDFKAQLKTALEKLLPPEASNLEIVIQDTPAGKPGDYGTPLPFLLAKALRANPVQIATDLASKIELPKGVARAEAVGPYLNFFVDAASFTQDVVNLRYVATPKNQKVIVEHTSVNPNKEWHVGHIRGALLGDAMGKIYRAAGFEVEIQNYIDDTGRQAAESIYAASRYHGANWLEVYEGLSEKPRLDHWLGESYVRLNREFPEKSPQKLEIEPEIAVVVHALERGELRGIVEKIVHAQLETAYSLGIEYDLLVWESDVVKEGFVKTALEIFGDRLQSPTEGKYAGAKGVDMTPFVPGLEEPFKVLVRGNGTFVYETKDIAYHYWKLGFFEGLEYQKFGVQPSGKTLWTSAPNGEHEPEGHKFAHADQVVNVIDARQQFPQMVVKAGLSLVSDGTYALKHHHLANETVLLEGETMSGRKGTTVPADDVVSEAKSRALNLLNTRSFSDDEEPIDDPGQLAAIERRETEISTKTGLGALKFAFLKAEPKRQIDFRWDQALALQGDTAPVVQYAYARARRIFRTEAWQSDDFQTNMRQVKEEESQKRERWAAKADWKSIGSLELDLAKVIAKYPSVLELCVRDVTPHPMCAYALELANAFNGYYNHKDANGKPDTSAIHAPEGLREARLLLIGRVADAIREALGVLGIEAPEEM
jgi:arginyl-tRNA synthetase